MNSASTFDELLKLCNKNKKFYEIAQEEEANLSECSISEIRAKTALTLNAMKNAIQEGLKSNELSTSAMVGQDCEKLNKYYSEKKGIFSKLMQKVIKYALATAEQNARMGKIAACPTAGACGIVPAVIIALAEENKINEEKTINALITAGIIGKLIAIKTALAGAVGGCQSECGVAAGMAAGAAVELLGGSNLQITNAAALALKNILGLVCDPIAGLVEVPCVKRNSFLAVHALCAAELAMAGVESIVPLDEVVDALKQIGSLMSPSLKESAQAGLATTPTGIQITEKLNKIWQH